MKTVDHKPARGSLQRITLTLALAAGLLAMALPGGIARAELTMALTGQGSQPLYVEPSPEADGYKFTTLGAPLEVNWLGLYDAPNDSEGTVGDGLLVEHRVSIWRESDQALMQRHPGDLGSEHGLCHRRRLCGIGNRSVSDGQ
jgi:hypothetical protein